MEMDRFTKASGIKADSMAGASSRTGMERFMKAGMSMGS